MKKALLYISLFTILFAVACTPRTDNRQALQPAAPAFDTTGLAAFQEWQFLNERKQASEYMQEQVAEEAPVRTVVRKTTPKKRVSPSAPVVQAPAPQETGVNEQPAANEGEGSMASENTGEAKEKKGISNAAKGTVIGAVSGAVLGAVINKKNRVVGGVVGGVLGGGVGYGIGRKMDKKEEQKEAQQETATSQLMKMLE